MELRLLAAQKNLHNRQRMEATLEMIEQLQAKGFQVTVLKGMTIGVLYRFPECRNSSDTDIFIDSQEEQAALAYMQELGFQVEARKEGSNHSECTHPRAGLFEVHVSFFDPLTKLPLQWTRDAIAPDRRM